MTATTKAISDTTDQAAPRRRVGGSVRLTVTCMTIIFGMLSLIVAPAASADTTPLAIGTLGTNPDHAAEESAGGVKVAMMELNWKRRPSSTSPNVLRDRLRWACTQRVWDCWTRG